MSDPNAPENAGKTYHWEHPDTDRRKVVRRIGKERRRKLGSTLKKERRHSQFPRRKKTERRK